MRESIALEPASLSALFICTRNLVLKSEAKNAIAIECIIKTIKEIIIIFIYTNINCFLLATKFERKLIGRRKGPVRTWILSEEHPRWFGQRCF